MSKPSAVSRIKDELTPFLSEHGYELYHIEMVKEVKDWYLRVYIDRLPGDANPYISTEDCEKVSRFLSERLDLLDPIEQNYYLEVSSPGMDRQLVSEAHYARYQGSQVDVKLYKPFEGVKSLTGRLIETNAHVLVLEDIQGRTMEIPREQVAKACLAVII